MKLAAVLVMGAAAAATTAPGVANPARAKMNWMLHCQGCHRLDATGSTGGAPSMAGQVALFLSVDGGRAFLTRVPGVANAALPDDQLAELLNWTLATFDAANMPPDFTPFSAEEVKVGRGAPLLADAATTRTELLKEMNVQERR